MNKILYGVLLLCANSIMVFAQTNISGIINSYQPVSAINNSSCSTCNNPACYTDITVSSSAAFTAGGIALIMQMKGSVIDETNTATFGNVSNNNNTGNFEFVNVLSIPNGTTVRVSTLTLTYSLPSSASPGVVQLITVPSYAANVNVNGTLTATPWNGTIGGVLVFMAAGKVTMNANIDVSGRGFRGFVHHETSDGDCAETGAFFVSDATQLKRGAFKGEGVALTIVNKERGRGKQANGGGGGVGHNGGGGGGGNGGTGGFGGQMYTGCVNIEGRGQGGLALTGTSSRVYMGGGGGTGDNNGTGITDPGSDGMNGGGIVIIMADSIVNTNSTVGYTGTTGPVYPASNQYHKTPLANSTDANAEFMQFDVLCQLTLNSVTVNANAAQNVTVRVMSHDKLNVLYGPVTRAVPAGTSTVALGLNIPPGNGYMLSFAGTTGSLMFGNNATGVYPYTVPDVIRIVATEPNAPGNNIGFAFNWDVTSQCASGGYKIDASGIDNLNGTDADGGGGGGAGGSIYLRSNGYRGIINMKAQGGKGADMLNGGCHAPGGGGGGGYICANTTPPTNVNRNVAGSSPGIIPFQQVGLCVTPPTGFNSHAATKGTTGMLCTVNLATPPCSLPLEFLSFTGKNEGDVNSLNWVIASKKGEEYFTVERSSDAVNFSSIGTVKAQGTSFEFEDQKPNESNNYYRLKKVHKDGNFSYSHIISIFYDQIDLSIYPNPNTGTFNVYFKSSGASKLDVVDIDGRMVYSISGNEEENLEVSDLQKGIYFVRLYSGSQVIYRKVVVY